MRLFPERPSFEKKKTDCMNIVKVIWCHEWAITYQNKIKNNLNKHVNFWFGKLCTQ